MSRSALPFSLALHAVVFAVVGWSSTSLLGHAGLGKTEIGVVFSPEEAGGLMADDAPAAPPAAEEITPPAFTPNVTPPSVVEVQTAPVTSYDPVPPPISTVATLPVELPSIPQPKKVRAEAHSIARAASERSRTAMTTASLGFGGSGGAAGAGRGGGGGPGYTPPQFLMRYKPPYPVEARAQRIEGVVMLLVSVDAAGRVLSAKLSQSSGHAVLDRAALTAIRTWRFVPAHQGAQAVSATVEVPIRFHFAA